MKTEPGRGEMNRPYMDYVDVSECDVMELVDAHRDEELA